MNAIQRGISFYISSFGGLSKEIWLLSVVCFLNRTGTMVLTFLTLYTLHELKWTVEQAAIVTTCFGFGSLAGSYLGGYLVDRIGTFKTMYLSLFLGGIGFMSLIFFKSFYPLCLAVFVAVTFADSFRPGIFTALTEYSKPENLTRSTSLIRLAINLGIAIGPAVGGLLATVVGYDPLFIIDGITCIVAGVYLVYKLKPKEKFIRKIKPVVKPKGIWSDYKFIFFLAMAIINLVVFFQILNVTPVFLKEILGMSEFEIGLFLTLNGLLIFVLEMPIIYFIEKKNIYYLPFMLGVLLIGISYTSFYFTFLPVIVIIVIHNVFISVGEIINFPILNTIAHSRSNEDNKGAYMGAITMMFSIAFILAPFCGLPIVELVGYNHYWTICLVACLVSFCGLYFVRKDFIA